VRARLLTDGPPRQYLVVFDIDEEFHAGLTAWAAENEIEGSGFTGVGGFREAVLGYYDMQAQSYVDIPVDAQVEVLVLAGDIARKSDDWVVHAHTVCGHRDGSTVGGHVQRAVVRPTLEVVVTASPAHLQRRHDPRTGLALIDLDAESEAGSGSDRS
jgi:predicted DNA-binding protein with PD1-like motif